MDGVTRKRRIRLWLAVGAAASVGMTALRPGTDFRHVGSVPKPQVTVESRERVIASPEGHLQGHLDGTLTLHDGGSVMAGEPLRHVFTFRNPFAHELKLDVEADLRKSCGCTTASLAHHRLPGGQSTTLAMEVDTRTKRGLVHEVVGVTWTDAQGRRYEYGYAIRAQVNMAIVCRPPELTFSKSEVASGAVKRFECSSDLELDWSRAALEPNTPLLEVVKQTVTESGGLQVELRRLDSESQAYQTSQLAIRVPRLSGEPASSAETTGPAVEGQLTVFSHHGRSLVVRPQFPSFQGDRETNTWTGRLLITGDAITSNAQVDSMHSSEGQVEVHTVPLGPDALQADVTVTPRAPPDGNGMRQMPLKIRMADGQEITVIVQLGKTA